MDFGEAGPNLCFSWITTTEAAPFVAVFDEWAPRTLTVLRSDFIMRFDANAGVAPTVSW